MDLYESIMNAYAGLLQYCEYAKIIIIVFGCLLFLNFCYCIVINNNIQKLNQKLEELQQITKENQH